MIDLRRISTALLCMVSALALGGPAAAQTSASRPAAKTLVMPFEGAKSPAHVYWLGEGSASLLTDFLQVFGAVTVPREERRSAFERLQLPTTASLTHATVIKVGQFVDATEVVVGVYEVSNDQLTVRARMMRLDAGRLLPEVVERGRLADVFAIYQRVARRLHNATAAMPAIPAGTVLSSPVAFELYIKGLIAETPTTQRSFLEQALKTAPSDDRLRLALWEVLTDLGDHLKALDVVQAVPVTSRHSRTARYFASLSQIELKRYEPAFETLKALQSESRSAEIMNALGVIQLRRAVTAQTGKPTYYFSQASQTDPTDPDYFFNLGYAYWLDRDLPAAMYWLREAVRLDPADGHAHYVLGEALQQTSAAAEAGREKELARRLSSTYAEWEKRASGGEIIPRGLERMKDRLDTSGVRVQSLIASSGQRDQAAQANFHLESARRAYQRQADREAEQELRRALYLSPYLAEAHLLLGRIHMRAGRAADAVQAFKIALWSEETAVAHVALAEAYLQLREIDAARAEVDRALVLDPGSAEAKALRSRVGPAPPRR